jgi:AcrR family transcriptional regulator
VTEVDGRTARRERNRTAVLDAVVDAFERGEIEPSVDEIAEAADVSVRSIYRYFRHRDDLVRAAMGHAIARVAPTMELDRVGEGDVEERIARFVDHRIAMYEELAPITRAAKRAAAREPLVADEFELGRLVLRRQFLDHFAAELAGLGPGDRTRAVIVAELPFQFESFEYLRRSTEGDTGEMRALLIDLLTTNLARFCAPIPQVVRKGD